MTAPTSHLPAAVRALAEGDLDVFAERFSNAGFNVRQPAHGIFSVKGGGAQARASVVISVGVHGDETAPIDMLAHTLEALSLEPHALAVDLLICVGNIDAIAAGKRFIDADLNRMFRKERGALAGAREALRADLMIAATAEFFDYAGPDRWHLDLHTAIRPSLYPTFAVVPTLISEHGMWALIGWLGQAEIGAIIMNPKSAGTFSYHSAELHGAAGSTLELGRVGELGKNDLTQFASVALALDDFLRGRALRPSKAKPVVFRVAQEIIKHSDAFTMAVSAATPNFTPLRQGEVIASDGEISYTVKHAQELVVFPNPDVRVGLRAGLMVVPHSNDERPV